MFNCHGNYTTIWIFCHTCDINLVQVQAIVILTCFSPDRIGGNQAGTLQDCLCFLSATQRFLYRSFERFAISGSCSARSWGWHLSETVRLHLVFPGVSPLLTKHILKHEQAGHTLSINPFKTPQWYRIILLQNNLNSLKQLCLSLSLSVYQDAWIDRFSQYKHKDLLWPRSLSQFE